MDLGFGVKRLGLRPKDALLTFGKAYLGNKKSSKVSEVKEKREN